MGQWTDTGRKAVALVAMFRDLSACNCIKCRYGGKRKSLSLGTYPDVPFTRAHSRHRAARRLLAAGVDPKAYLASKRSVAEGFSTSAAAYALAQKFGVEMPITG